MIALRRRDDSGGVRPLSPRVRYAMTLNRQPSPAQPIRVGAFPAIYAHLLPLKFQKMKDHVRAPTSTETLQQTLGQPTRGPRHTHRYAVQPSGVAIDNVIFQRLCS
jgi:hypothetical protein